MIATRIMNLEARVSVRHSLTLLCGLAGAVAAQGPAPEPVTVFRDVNVVPMDRERVLPHRTVVVRGGRIAALLPAGAAVPAGARVVEGNGLAWLIPGLADMHVHLLDRDELLLYLANGITTVRNLHGLPRHLAWRDSIAAGALPGPRLVTSGPIVDGDPPSRATNTVVRTAADVERVVTEQKAAGYDAIKIYDNLPRDLYEALVRSARRHGLPVVGHVPTPVGLDGLLAVRGQRGIEHVEELLPFFADGRDTAGLGAMAKGLARAGVWVTPTLTVHRSALDQARDWPADQARPELAFLNPATARSWGWSVAGEGRAASPAAAARFARTTEFFERSLVPALHRAGVGLLAGSDAPIPTIMPGFALADELRALARAGLTPYEALATATSNPARFLGRESEIGTVAPGRAADLVLLSADPLADIANVERRLGVMAAGRWYHQTELRTMLERQANAYAASDSGAARRQVLEVVRRLLHAMEVRDTGLLSSLFVPGARLLGMRPKDGEMVLQALTVPQFAAFVANDRRDRWVERLHAAEVRIDGTLATVWARYDFRFGDRFSHCGTDAFQLLRTGDGWKIVSLADTYRTEGCG